MEQLKGKEKHTNFCALRLENYAVLINKTASRRKFFFRNLSHLDLNSYFTLFVNITINLTELNLRIRR